jgi:hypothetical protein
MRLRDLCEAAGRPIPLEIYRSFLKGPVEVL